MAVGATFPSRVAAQQAGVHRYGINGIDYDGSSGLSVAIVLNGGYADDEDHGDWVIYTGEGGQDASRKRQVADQTWTKGNEGLRRAHIEGAPVRVLRGPRGDWDERPPSGYRYDGLYDVTQVAYTLGQDGYHICQFLLERSAGHEGLGGDATPVEGAIEPRRRAVTSNRVLRDTKVARDVKLRHGHRCQICATVIETPGGPYAEGAHIQPLGALGNGRDTPDNVLCLCPNDHTLFDRGALLIDDDFTVRSTRTGDAIARLRLVVGHRPALDVIRFHRENIASQDW